MRVQRGPRQSAGFIDKVTSEQRLEGGEGRRCGYLEEGCFGQLDVSGSSICKGPEAG